jgi:hypothetical protein
MKLKIIFSLCCFFLIFSTVDEDNISIEVDRLEDESIEVSWLVQYEDYDQIFLEIQHLESNYPFQVPSKRGELQLCCYPGEVKVILTVKITRTVDETDENCNAVECVEYVRETFQNTALLVSKVIETTTTSTTTTSTTTTTIPPPIVESTSFLDIEITNEIITSIPLFDDIDLTDQEKNSIAFIMTTVIIVLFYLVLLLQEWFNKILSEYKVRFFRKENEIISNSRFTNFLKILFALTMTAFLIGYVEEGASLVFDLENLAVFLAAFTGLISVTFFYEGIEGLIEKFIFKQKVRFRWAPQAIFFALISTLAFVYLNMPIGFIFGFIASSYILNSRPNAKLSPKFYSSISLSAVGFGFFYLTSLPFILESTVFTAIAAISYLMCIEGVLLKALPGGGNELLESLNDSTGVYKIFPLLSFLLGLWLFIRILIVSPDSEFANLQQDLLSMGSFSLTFALMLVGYMISIFIIGLFIKVKSKNE